VGSPPREIVLQRIELFLLFAPVLLASMVAHEYAHGYAALKQGDTTAQQLGRLTWNPIRHIDPVMTVILPLLTYFGGGLFGQPLIFGGAKPVPVNPQNYRSYRRGDIIVSLAGVATNALLVLACIALIVIAGLVARVVPTASTPVAILQTMLIAGISFNLVLVAFNLLPIPPLDGSHVVKHLLPPALAVPYQRLGFYGMFLILALLLFLPRALQVWMRPMSIVLEKAMRIVMPYVVPSPWTSIF
jgi:Zn-dependent protease